MQYPQWTGRRDKRGIPVYVFEVASLNSKRMSAYQNSLSANDAPTKGNISPNLRRLFALYENLIQFVMPLCSALPTRPFPDTPISQASNIVDISKTGLKQFWNLKGHMQEASTLATAHYPETLDRIFIIGAPSFFPTVWSWIKRWFDPITVSKIFILGQHETYKVLSEYIDPRDIPKKYGGQLDWEWGHLPYLDDDIIQILDWKMPATGEHGGNAFPPGPIRWRNSSDDKSMESVALGSIDGKQREDVIAAMPVPQDTAINKTPTRPDLARFSSTTGEHTHPADGVETFPTTGTTTPSGTPVGTDSQSTSSNLFNANGLNSTGNAVVNKRTVPIQQNGFAQNQQASEVRQNEVREGTSETRQDFQTGTHAEGVHADSTPAVIDHGHGDKSKAVEPSTIAQGAKEVQVPERQAEAGQETYVDQAKAAVGGAAASVGAVGAGLAEKVGLSSKSESVRDEADEKNREEEESRKVDPEVEKMGDVEVEDFVRSKYASSNSKAGKADNG